MDEPTIWMYWTTPRGSNGRPPYLNACLESIRRNSGCRLLLCDERTAREFAPELPDCFSLLTPNHQSDLFRLHVLTTHGGMYLDFDTVVLRSLVPLFEALNEVEIVVADWRPQRLPQEIWQPIGTTILGPMRPELPFMRAARELQAEVLRKKESLLLTARDYPFAWGELIEVVTPAFLAHPPVARLKEGAATWFGIVGGPTWFGGNIGHALQTLEETGPLPDSELFTIANSLMPEELKRMPIEQLLEGPTVLAYLLQNALGQGLSQSAQLPEGIGARNRV